MLSTMQDASLSVSSIVKFSMSTFGDTEVTTATENNGTRRRTFAEVGDRACRLATGLRELGVGLEDRVATFMWNNVEHLEAYVAVPAMGSVLHTLNIRLSPEQITYIANHAADRVLARVLEGLSTVHTVLVVGDGDRSPLQAAGKTILDYDRAMPVVPMFHANAWGTPYAGLAAGAHLVMPDRFLTAEALVRLIENEKVAVSQGVPTIWNDVLHYLRANPGHDVSSLRSLLCGGSAVSRSLIEDFEREFGVMIVQAWGMTETSPVAAVALPPRGVARERAIDYRSMTGRPLFGAEARIVGDDGTPQPHNGTAIGELEMRGPWVTASYYRDPDSSRLHDGWRRTGDIGTIDPRGYLKLTDRAKDAIKSGGEWVSSADLEGHLMAHPSVLEASVVGVPDKKWEERPLAVIVVKPDATVTVHALLEHLRGRVPRWWLPERWTFVDAVPKTSVRKFDKKIIRREYAEGVYHVVQV
jgi:acyl-CoA synthetase (AMP-forming)/AMP-acid ligase II